ncbi:DUF4231 domain-containing protein [Chondrinema litorale]|uniref:DUF4231 domain-containing protein n=1 Tax=Chondrinema litorale TaxID=2994555 RepID=UPI0025432B05|nr:DUF4231 domain-containing protein [Chondrinema litorale]UZR95371.1 DUF4231 domain-containing protein [Chondrinema litorale]
MNIQEYIESRLESQRKWYEQKANISKKSFMNYQKIIITLGAVIPVNVILFTLVPENIKAFEGLLNAIISCIIAIVAGFDKLSQPQTNWFNYRANEEVLKKEKHLFEFKAGPYRDIDSEEEMKKLLVERVESVISADISRFVQTQKTKDEKNKKIEIEESVIISDTRKETVPEKEK